MKPYCPSCFIGFAEFSISFALLSYFFHPGDPVNPASWHVGLPGVHPTQSIDYSESFSDYFQESFWGCARLFEDYLGVILKGFRG